MSKRKILFVDRDGTLIEEPADEQIDRLDKLKLVPGVIPALLAAQQAGFELVMVTNQDGLGTDSFPQEDFDAPHNLMMQILESQGVRFSAVHIDDSFPADKSPMRKPEIGMVLDYLKSGTLDLDRSAVIGDRETDLQLAQNMGIKGYLLSDSCTWETIISQWIHADRTATRSRTTQETDIRCTVHLDGNKTRTIATGIGFFDHMLDQLAKHGGFGLELTCEGDLEIDQHHTVEDTAIVLGQTLREALGDKRGIGRYGFVLPMDETLAQVAIDIGGRAWCEFDADFPRDYVGELDVEMVPHFFRSFADALGATLHVSAAGLNTHHMVEGIFKGVAKALQPALQRDANSSDLPSTKGLLA